MLYIIALLLIVLAVKPTVTLLKRSKKVGPWINRQLIKLSIVTMIDIMVTNKIDEKTLEGFSYTQELMFKEIKKHKEKFNRAKQIEIEDAVGIGLVSYMDLILLYTYVTTQDNHAELYIEYRHRYFNFTKARLKRDFIPTNSFEFYDFLDTGE